MPADVTGRAPSGDSRRGTEPATIAATDAELGEIATRVGDHLRSGARRITTAESCTGGWIGKALTDVPGSSQWFETGYICYGNDAKIALLGVSPTELVAHGAVSETVVKAMALGALQRAGADVAVAVSGIAGPDGGTPEKPVGTVWIAWAWRRGPSIAAAARLERYTGDRDAVRRQAVSASLTGVLEL